MGVRLTRAALASVVSTSLYACTHPRHLDLDELDRSLVAAPGPRSRTVDATAVEHATETGTLAAMIQLALTRNPDLLVERARVEELLARVPLAARRPDLELTYEQWGVPLVRPYALNEADTLMVGISQTFPAPGALDAGQRAAVAAAEVALYALRARRLDIVRQVERAYLELGLIDGEIAIHREHAELAQQVIELTRSNLRAGGASQQDALRVAVELQRLHRDLARLEQRRRSAVALLNALAGRTHSASLTPAPAQPLREVTRSIDDLQTLAASHRPELAGAARGIERGRAGTDAARSAATWPSIMVGVDYMFMPFMEERHGYGAMVSINVPWLNPRHRDEVKAAERAVDAERRSAEAAAIAVRFEVDDAYARYQATRTSYSILTSELQPTARQSLQAAQTGFAAGRTSALSVLDALRVLLEVRLDELRELFALQGAIADLERAVGTEVVDAAPAPANGGSHE